MNTSFLYKAMKKLLKIMGIGLFFVALIVLVYCTFIVKNSQDIDKNTNQNGNFSKESLDLVKPISLPSKITSPIQVEDNTLYYGSTDKTDPLHPKPVTYAFDLEKEEVLWRAEGVDGRVPTRPVRYKDMVLVGNDGRFERSVYAFDAETGEERWRFEAASNNHDANNIYDVSAIRNNILYFTVEESVIALDLETQDVKWRVHPISDDEAYYFGAGPHILMDDQIIIKGFGLNKGAVNVWLLALNQQSGETNWIKQISEYDIESPLIHTEISNIALSKNMLYFFTYGSIDRGHSKVDSTTELLNIPPEKYSLWCINAETGKVVWRDDMPYFGNDLVINGGTLLYTKVSDQTLDDQEVSILYAFNLDLTQAKIGVEWSEELANRITTKLYVVDDQVYFGTEEGEIMTVSFDSQETETIFTFEEKTLIRSLLFRGDRVYVVGDDEKVYVLKGE